MELSIVNNLYAEIVHTLQFGIPLYLTNVILIEFLNVIFMLIIIIELYICLPSLLDYLFGMDVILYDANSNKY